MTKIEKIILLGGVAIMALGTLLGLFRNVEQGQPLGGFESLPPEISRVASSTRVYIPSEFNDTKILSTSSERIWAEISLLPGGTSTVWLSFNDVPVFATVTSSHGFQLSSTTPRFTINAENRYTGAIRARGTGTTSVLTIQGNIK